MKQYLLFRLYGPMVSWGDIAVGEQRPIYAHPSKSAIIGMIGAALGMRRDDETRHRDLAESLRVAVRVDAPGELLRDYHTVQTPTTKRGVHHPTRKSELEADEINTMLTYRDYRCDASAVLCVWTASEASSIDLSLIRRKLREPEFTLYLGRKSCPPALPLEPTIIEAESVRSAFEAASFSTDELLELLRMRRTRQVFWEGESNEGFDTLHTVTKRDQPSSRIRWQFSNRAEHTAMIELAGGTGDVPE